MLGKLGGSLLCLLFAGAFGAGGWVGLDALGTQVGGWWQARSWQPVMVTVISARMDETRSRKSHSYRAVARYTYDVDGSSFEGTRVGFTDACDNIGSWQQDRYAELEHARRTGTKVVAWADPRAPERAVIDRGFRWGLTLLLMPFAVVFPLVSLVALALLVRTWLPPPA